MRSVAHQTMSRVRRYRLDGNPLRRRSDRIEAVVVALALVAFLGSFWLAALAMDYAYRQGLLLEGPVPGVRQPVTAVVLAVGTATPELTGTELPGTMVSWITSAGQERTARARVALGAKAGDHVTVWVNERDNITDPPQDRTTTVTGAIAVAFAALAGAASLLLLLVTGARWVLDRGRLAEWESAWAAADAQWHRRKQT